MMKHKDFEAICPECKKVINRKRLITKSSMMREILQIVKAKDKTMLYPNSWTWEQMVAVYKWIKEKK